MNPRIPLAFRLAFSLAALASLAGCLAPVSRTEMLQTAHTYATHAWTPTRANILHGPDSNGVWIDTPDADWFGPTGWRPGETFVGLPYCWGGADSLAAFDAGIAAGRPAGYTFRNRSRPPESPWPVGVDCSGFVSQCWRLNPRRATYNLAEVCTQLASYDDLRPGDVLNRPKRHVMLFKQWADDAHTRMRVYESSREKVKESEHEVAQLQHDGFVPLRYRAVVDR